MNAYKSEVLFAATVIKLAEEHKKHCDGECGISLFHLREPLEKMLGRKLTAEESSTLI